MPTTLQEAKVNALANLRKEIDAIGAKTDHSKYQDDPVGFGREIFGHEYTEDIQQMMRSVVDNRVTLACSATDVGKTFSAADIAHWFYRVFRDSQVITAAAPPERNLRQILWGEIEDRILKHPDLFKEDKPPKTLHIARGPRSFITGVTIPITGTEHERESRFSGKHMGHQLFIIDEGDAIEDAIYRAIDGAMSSEHARLLVLFNPRMQTGELWRMQEDGIANVINLSALRHPNVVTGENRVPGCVSRETVVIRINRWCRKLAEGEKPGQESFELPEFLAGAVAEKKRGFSYPPLSAGWYQPTSPEFDYMVLGRYPSQAVGQLIPREWVSKARSEWDSYVAKHGEKPPAMIRPILGLDVAAQEGVDSNALCSRWGNWVGRITRWSGVDMAVTQARVAKEYRERNAYVIHVDALGVGAGVAANLNKMGCYAKNIIVSESPTAECEFGKFYRLRDQLWWAVRDWLNPETGCPMLPPDKELIEELCYVKFWEGRTDKLIRVTLQDTIRENLKRSPNASDALRMTLFAGETWADGCIFTERRKCGKIDNEHIG